jgi:membrane protein YqaA with SNARE-associated domain
MVPHPGPGTGAAERTYRRWGLWTLLLSWVPVIGDPLTVVAGLLKATIGLFLLLVTVAKAGRYLAVAGMVQLF